MTAEGDVPQWRRLAWLPGTFAVCRLDASRPIPRPRETGSFFSLTRTDREVSVVCAEGTEPAGGECERGWRGMRLEGPIPFSITGVLASLTAPLALARIPIFAVSTYETDTLFVRAPDAERARQALEAAGFLFGD